MILDVPYIYTAHGYRPRTRNLIRYDHIDSAPVKLRELSDGEAPIVARCRYPTTHPVLHPHAPGRLSSTDAVAETDYRILDGRLMRRAVLDNPTFLGAPGYVLDAAPLFENRAMSDALRAAVAEEQVVDVTAELAQSAMHLLAWGITRGARVPVLRKPGDQAPVTTALTPGWTDMNRIQSDDRRERATEMRRAMEGAAIVDGILYLPSFGPGWQLMQRLTADAPVAAVANPEMGWYGGGMGYALMYHGGDEDLMEVGARRLDDMDGPKELRRSGAIEILDPAAHILPPDELSLRAFAQQLLVRHQQIILEMRSPAALHALADIMAFSQDLEASGDEMEPALTTLVAEYQARYEPGVAYDWMRVVMERYLERVELRRDNPDLGIQMANPAIAKRASFGI